MVKKTRRIYRCENKSTEGKGQVSTKTNWQDFRHTGKCGHNPLSRPPFLSAFKNFKLGQAVECGAFINGRVN